MHHARVLLHIVISVLGRFAGFKFLRWRSVFGLFCIDREGLFIAGVCVREFIFSGDEAFFFWVGRMRLGMENCFFVEAKSFSFSVEIGKSKVWLEERKKGFIRVVSLGLRCVAWLIEMVEEVLLSAGAEEFVKTTPEASNVVTVKRGGNRDERFLEVAFQVMGCRRGFILLLEGREGRRWSRFSGGLSKAIAFFEAMKGPPSDPSLGMGVFLQPQAKKASTQTLVQPLGALVEDAAAGSSQDAEDGGRVV